MRKTRHGLTSAFTADRASQRQFTSVFDKRANRWFNNLLYKALEESAGREWACQVSLLNKLIDKFGEIVEMYTYLNAYKNHSNQNLIEEREAFKEFKKTILKGDYLYEFHYDDGKVQQSGFIILNNGEIRRREVYHTTIPAE